MVDFSHAISLVGEFAEAARFQQLSQVTSIIECPDQIPAIGFVELLHLLTTVFGTKRTSQSRALMSALWGNADITWKRRHFRFGPGTDIVQEAVFTSGLAAILFFVACQR